MVSRHSGVLCTCAGGAVLTYRSRRHLDLAHDMPCTAQFDHTCTGYQGCEPAHSNMQVFGRGAGFKTPDWAWAAMCHNAHMEIDSLTNLSREQKQAEWLLAYVRTQNHLFSNKLIGPLTKTRMEVYDQTT